MSTVVGMKPRKFAIVDTDVHHNYKHKSDLYPYMTRFNAERFDEYGMGVQSSYAFNGGKKGRRIDIIDEKNPPPAELGPVAYDVEDTKRRLLDAYGIDLAVLTGGPGQVASTMMDVDYGSAVCRAFNDFSMEHWIAKDSRYRLLLHINSQDPVGAVAEIDRLGPHPAVCGIMLGCGSPRPFGNRVYHPIYEACVRHDLAVAMHFGAEGTGTSPPPSAGGYPSYYIEGRQLRSSYYAVHVVSFIFEGVFEKFPTLRMGLLEAGFAWIAPLMWKMDLDWKGLRRQTPWVKELPSHYLKKHMRFATQPMEEPDHPDALKHVIEWIDGANTLMFATDYPHWDWDDPTMILAGFPDDMRRKIFSENALSTFGLTLPALSQAAA